VGGGRVSVGLGRAAVCCPSRVPDADRPLHGLVNEPPGKIGELAFGAAAFVATVDQSRYSGRIVTAIFEPPEPVEQAWSNHLLGDDANNAAHQFFLRSRARRTRARPGLSTCWP